MPDGELFDLPHPTKSRCDLLISLRLARKLTSKEQLAIANEVTSYRNMALRTEEALHRWSKVFEEAGVKL